jgi:hypothetical protein
MTEHNLYHEATPLSGHPGLRRSTLFKGMHLLESDEALLANLAPKEQAVLRSSGSYEERARELNIPLGTLRSRLHRAWSKLVALRSQMQPDPH